MPVTDAPSKDSSENALRPWGDERCQGRLVGTTDKPPTGHRTLSEKKKIIEFKQQLLFSQGSRSLSRLQHGRRAGGIAGTQKRFPPWVSNR